MSPQALQRFVVRMLFDPTLVDQVYDHTDIPGLDADSRALLIRPDRRAWGTDPYRRTRALTALLEEFPASAGQAGVAKLDAYFSSEIFHTVCDQRGSMALGFGSWVERLAGPVARLETALARVRRPRPPAGPGIVLSPTAAVIELPAGTLDQYQALRDQLGAHPVHTLVEGHIRPVALPDSASSQHLLVQGSPQGDISLTVTSPVLAQLLMAAQKPLSNAALQATAEDLGAGPGESVEIISELMAEGLLVTSEA